jgi:hypothetical protein
MHAVACELYCEGCYDELFEICETCETIIEREYAHFDDEGYPYCDSCYERRFSDRYFEATREATSRNDLMVKDAFGVEIESYCQDNDYLHDYDETGYFSAVGDGSLGDGGVEYVSVPLVFDIESYKILHNFTNALREGHNLGKTCGCHIHLNLLPYVSTEHATISQISVAMKKLMVGYKAIEDYFYSLMPQSRQSNWFCRRMNDLSFTSLMRKKGYGLISYFYSENIVGRELIPKQKYPSRCDKRYYWANAHALFYMNTLEIRLFGGTLNSRKIIMWAKINRKIVRYLMTHSIKEARNFSREKLFEMLDEKERKFLVVREGSGKGFRPVEEMLGGFFV